MLKISKGFNEARNKRFAEKEKAYGGKSNPYNWRNLRSETIVRDISYDAVTLDKLVYGNGGVEVKRCKKLCADIANRCELLWRKLR